MLFTGNVILWWILKDAFVERAELMYLREVIDPCCLCVVAGQQLCLC